MSSLVHRFLSEDKGMLNLLFLLIMIFWLLLVFFFDGLFYPQLISIFLLTLTYFFWGVSSHYIDHTLHLKNVLEYLLISFIGFLILSFLLI